MPFLIPEYVIRKRVYPDCVNPVGIRASRDLHFCQTSRYVIQSVAKNLSGRVGSDREIPRRFAPQNDNVGLHLRSPGRHDPREANPMDWSSGK